MNRTCEYRRLQRSRVIRRKKRISHMRYGLDFYEDDGRYSKGKIHCSCQICREKDHRGRHLITKSELIALDRLRDGLSENDGEDLAS